MADDLGTLYTDKKLQTLERKLKAEYRKAQKDIEEKTKVFFNKAAAKDKVMQSRLNAGKITQEEYDHWRQGKIFYGENWKAQQESIAKVLADTNKVATAMINGEKADVFAFNGNYTGYELEHGFGVNFGFDLYSEKSVERLLKDNPKLMPPKKLDRRKDIPWNMRNIRSQVTQGLIQGESIPKIAKRLSEVVPNRNAKQMVLHARTAMTGAQNGGRMERFKEAEALGIKFKKVWIATLDSRTRDRHADLDGQAVKPDEYFDSGKFRILYPGDPNGEPSTVWNCRCTLGTKLDDYPRTFTRRVQEDGSIISEQSYRQWEASKQAMSDKMIPDTDGVMKGVKKTSETTVAEIVKAVNKHFTDGREWQYNCANCAVAAEARARGYDVISKERDFSKNNKIPSFWYDDEKGRGSWTDSFEGIKNEEITKAYRRPKILGAVKEKMEEYGDGSRAIIFVQWDNSKSGHYFNVTNDGGNIVFFDPQSGEMGENVENYFLRSVPSKNRIFRVDDKNLTDYIRKVVNANE